MTNTKTCTIHQVGETLVSDHCIFAKKKKKIAYDFLTFPFLIELYRSHNRVQSSVSSPCKSTHYLLDFGAQLPLSSHKEDCAFMLFFKKKQKREKKLSQVHNL